MFYRATIEDCDFFNLEQSEIDYELFSLLTNYSFFESISFQTASFQNFIISTELMS